MGVLQDSGWADASDEAPPARPAMVMGIVHESASVWDLKWCPSRTSTWDLPEGTPMPEDMLPHDDQLPRLGLLAAAFADGSVKIYSVPYPPSLTRGTCGRTIGKQNTCSLHICLYRTVDSARVCTLDPGGRVQAIRKQRHLDQLVPS